MPKKPRSQRRRKGGDSSNKSGDNSNIEDAEYLSECHTIATMGSVNTNDSSADDNWEMDNDDLLEDGNEDQQLRRAEIRHEKLLDILGTVHDFSSEKRSSKRELLLRQWFRGLTQYATAPEPVETRRDDLIQACQTAIRSGSPSEQYASCRVLEAMCVLIGDDEYYEQIEPFLIRVIQSTHRAVPVRVAALRALGLSVFIGVQDDMVTEQVLDLCETIAQADYRNEPTPSALRATALDIWTLLATTIHELYVSGKDDVSTGRGLLLLPLLLECLEQKDDASLRAAAGECVAWIHTARVALGYLENDNDDGDGDSHAVVSKTQQKYAPGTWEGSEWEDLVTEIEMIMEELSNQSGHYMSKKAKKEQRATFREYLATLQEDESPTHTIQFRGGSLELTSWKDIIAVNAARRCLQGGFQIQLLTNPILQAIFGANASTLNAHGGYSQLEKRLLLSKTSEASKAKDLDRHKKRRDRNNVKNHFLMADGDDI